MVQTETPGTVTSWPVARRYRGSDRVRISLPVGGIGTGTVGFGGRGQFRDWELENRPSKGLRSELTFLACRVSGNGTPPQAARARRQPFRRGGRGCARNPRPRWRGCRVSPNATTRRPTPLAGWCSATRISRSGLRLKCSTRFHPATRG